MRVFILRFDSALMIINNNFNIIISTTYINFDFYKIRMISVLVLDFALA